MTPSAVPLGNDYLCDLCRRRRPRKLRIFGGCFIDGYWACAACYRIYSGMLAGAEKEGACKSHASLT